MFKSLHDFFTAKSGTLHPSVDKDLALAAATLMFEVIRSDGQTDKIELIAMGEVLRQQFGFTDDDITTMIELARNSSKEATSLQSFTRQICDNWGNGKRLKLLEHLWVIALADKNIDTHERHLVRKIGSLLYLNEGQIVGAREAAKTRLGISDF